MDVEIWSDVMCPFCYIGKRKFEQALAQFPHKEQVNIVWKSFQLNPDQQTLPGKNTVEHLAEVKGWSLDEAKRMTDHVTGLAREVGLSYDFDKAVVANSWDAHRLVQLAKKHGLGDAAEERLFLAYFTEGRNTADHATLLELGTDIGLDSTTVQQMLDSNQFADAVAQDVYEAQQVGARGVPFFVLNRQFAVSGAQQPETFLGALTTAWGERVKG
ncbi:DsbA family oxidoreductase [Fibrella aquatica]|uniref:DsbA family oxidoreductase n=1 Tax=Fibrella aquatica TaxID=3242487 RepID=UPI00352289FC